MGGKVFKYYWRTITQVRNMGVKKKSVSFDPQLYKAVCNHQADLIKKLGRPVRFSEALMDLLRTALKGPGPG